MLPVKGGAKTAEVPAVAVDAVPAESNGGGLGLLTTLGIGAGILMIAWGAVPQETKDHFKEVLWEQPKKEVKVVAAATAVVGAVYLAATFLPPLLVTTLPSAPALTPALAGGGMAGGGMALQPAAVGTVKAALLAGGGALVLKKLNDDGPSYATSESGDSGRGKYSGRKVSEILSEKKASIKNAPLEEGSPNWDAISRMSWEEIEAGARANRPGFKTVRKLLTNTRFDK